MSAAKKEKESRLRSFLAKMTPKQVRRHRSRFRSREKFSPDSTTLSDKALILSNEEEKSFPQQKVSNGIPLQTNLDNGSSIPNVNGVILAEGETPRAIAAATTLPTEATEIPEEFDWESLRRELMECIADEEGISEEEIEDFLNGFKRRTEKASASCRRSSSVVSQLALEVAMHEKRLKALEGKRRSESCSRICNILPTEERRDKVEVEQEEEEDVQKMRNNIMMELKEVKDHVEDEENFEAAAAASSLLSTALPLTLLAGMAGVAAILKLQK